MDTISIAEQIEKLDVLRRNNAISDEEFNKLKSQAMQGSDLSTHAVAPPVSSSSPPSPASGGMTKTTLGLAAIFAAGLFFLFPLTNEGTTSECVALENTLTRFMAQSQSAVLGGRADGANTFLRVVMAMSQGQAGAKLARESYPSWPEFIGCTLSYYEIEWNALKLATERAKPG